MRNIKNRKIGEIIKNNGIEPLPDWVGLEMLRKALLDSLQIVQKLQQLPELARGCEEFAKHPRVPLDWRQLLSTSSVRGPPCGAKMNLGIFF